MPGARLNTDTDIANRAYGYSRDKSGVWFENDQSKTSATAGDGGIYASTAELMQWHKALYTSEAILARTFIEKMTTPHIQRPEPAECYGYGIVITKIGGFRCFYHAGESCGFRNGLFYLPDHNVSMALLSNQDTVDMCAVAQVIVAEDIKIML